MTNSIKRKEKRGVACFTAFMAAGFFVLCAGCGQAEPASSGSVAVFAPVVPEDAPVLGESYPVFDGGGLRFARLIDLPDDVLLQTEGLLITEKDLQRELSKAPARMREQLLKNAFFVLEQKATHDLILILARHKIADNKLKDDRLIKLYFEEITKDVVVSDPEIKAFYSENKAMLGEASLEELSPRIRQHLEQEKQQNILEGYVGSLGKQMVIALSEKWIKAQAELASDNVVEKARASGKPTFLSFGADACMPCKMMAPFRDEIKEKYSETLNVLYVNVNQEQVMASRYGVKGIPHIIFFDADGKEFHVQSGFMSLEQIEEYLSKMGVKK